MSSLDLRFVIPVLLNMLKSFLFSPSDWDPFNLFFHHPTWPKTSLFVFMFLFFPFTSIKISISNTSAHLIIFERQSFSMHLTILLLGSIVLPQQLFWLYAYFAVHFTCYPTLLLLLERLVGWLHAKLSSTTTHPANVDTPTTMPQIVAEVFFNEQIDLEANFDAGSF